MNPDGRKDEVRGRRTQLPAVRTRRIELCECCGHPDVTCRVCGRTHVPAVADGCEACSEECRPLALWRTRFRHGQTVRFRAAPDIEVDVLSITIEEGAIFYRVTWWRDGTREVESVIERELEEVSSR